MSQNCDCKCECPTSISLPITGIGLNVNPNALEGLGIKPGPDNTHLVTREGKLVWESVDNGSGYSFITDDVTLYIATNGDDGNDGLSPATAFRTFFAFTQWLNRVDMQGHKLKLVYMPGTYDEPLVVNPSHNRNWGEFQIESYDPNNRALIKPTGAEANMFDHPGGFIKLKNIKLAAPTGGVCFTLRKSFIYFEGDISFEEGGDRCLQLIQSHCFISANCKVSFSGTYSDAAIYCGHQSLLQTNSSSTLHFDSITANVIIRSAQNSIVCIYSASVTGNATGKRYDI